MPLGKIQNQPAMKTKISFSLLLAAAATGLSFGQTAFTTPVGYVTSALPANQFSFVGLTLHSTTVSSGIITAESATSVTAGTTNFLTLLGTPNPASSTPLTYVLELGDGTIQEITNWTAAGVLTTPGNITANVTPGTTTYKLRKAKTIAEIFGATNTAGLVPDSDGDFATGNDLIFVPGEGGATTTVYYFNDGSAQGWFNSAGDPAGDLPIVYADGFYIKRSTGSTINLIVSGEVKKESTSGVIAPGFNFLSSAAPTGVTLSNSGLQAFITPDTTGNFSLVDNILIPQANGTFKTAYYFNDGSAQGWFDSAGDDASQIPLEGGFLIRNRGISKPYKISVPASYSSL
jgi:hypothetical protein